MYSEPRHRAHIDRVIKIAGSNSQAAKSHIAASWRRSFMNHNLTPDAPIRKERLGSAELSQARDRVGRLVSVATPVIDRLFKALGDAGLCILLTDKNGVVVDDRYSPVDEKMFARDGLVVGASWSEKEEGTNGIGTCVVDMRPITVTRDQHFFARNISMCCVAAPLFDHLGQLIGALDVSSCRDDASAVMTAFASSIVNEAARRIEQEYFIASFPDARIVVAPDFGGDEAGLIAVDRDDLVIGATRSARRIYSLTDEKLNNPRPADDILRGPQDEISLGGAARVAIVHALARANGNATLAAQTLNISRATLYRRMKRYGVR